jgi:hypothetical protein
MPKRCLSWRIVDIMGIDGSGGEESSDFFGDSGVDGGSEHVKSHAVDAVGVIHAILQRFDAAGQLAARALRMFRRTGLRHVGPR